MSITKPDETQPVRLPDGQSGNENQKSLDQTRSVKIERSAASVEETMPMMINSTKLDASPSAAPEQPPQSGYSGDVGNIPGGETLSPPPPKKKKGTWLLVLAGLFLIVLVGGIGSLLGYQSGMKARLDNEYDQIAVQAVTQFQLGVEDQNAGRLNMARQRFEYVIQLDPNFPGIQEHLSAVMLYQAQTNVPTLAPTITPIPVTPTPDTRGIEEKFNAAVAYMRANEWENAVAALELVRKEDINYRTTDIDGMFYTALRFRGIQKITTGNLEPGIYDLTLSERFAPLDASAGNYRNWARYYLTGASFWGVDWGKVIELFGDVYLSMPNMIDSSGFTAQERYRIAALKYAEQLVSEGKYCEAKEYYELSLSIGGDESTMATATKVQELCEPPVEETEAPAEVTDVPTEEPVETETPAAPTDPVSTEPVATDSSDG